MMFAVPAERRWVLEERMDLADFFELVDTWMLKNARRLAESRPRARRRTGGTPTSGTRSSFCGVQEVSAAIGIALGKWNA